MTQRFPDHVDQFLSRALPFVESDERFSALLIAGSAISGEMDEFSDIDLILVCNEDAYDQVMVDPSSVAAEMGGLLTSFVGHHVGEPRLLVCLFGDPLIHVDLKFVTAECLNSRVETPIVLWQSDERLTELMRSGTARWPNQTPEWFEERIWVFVNYVASKLGRGELFAAIRMIGEIRNDILGPMIARGCQRQQRGVRRLEQIAPNWIGKLRKTLCGYSRLEILEAITAAADLYIELREFCLPTNRNPDCERSVRGLLQSMMPSSSQLSGDDVHDDVGVAIQTETEGRD